MPDWLELLILATSPVWVCWAAVRLGLARGRWSNGLIVAAAALVPGAWLFLATRNADAITNAAAYPFAFAVSLFWGLPLAGIAFSIARRR